MTFLVAETSQTPVGGGLWGSLFFFALMLGLFYIMLIRPQQKQQKQRQDMIDALKTGDKVTTIGGIHGEIVKLDDDDVVLRVTEGVEIKITKGGVGRVK